MGWSWFDKIVWVVFTFCGFVIGYNMSAHSGDISLWFTIATCFFLGMGYSYYLTIKKMEKVFEEPESDW